MDVFPTEVECKVNHHGIKKRIPGCHFLVGIHDFYYFDNSWFGSLPAKNSTNIYNKAKSKKGCPEATQCCAEIYKTAKTTTGSSEEKLCCCEPEFGGFEQYILE
ncbi:hypothetical protein FQA47_008913 [Oryzias melastigma]|uniref:Uncharacterized protein n=1 Tax=Oryzias melastigma TaxID=30732 RepID=A0A834EW53_ORYME|nr:hypothetical protein FQA47_008913 [Oryzias melastigma]